MSPRVRWWVRWAIGISYLFAFLGVLYLIQRFSGGCGHEH